MENKPTKRFSAGGVTATIWKNEAEKDNNKYSFYTITIDRSYKDGEVWKKTNSMSLHDLPRVNLVTSKAYEFIALKNEE